MSPPSGMAKIKIINIMSRNVCNDFSGESFSSSYCSDNTQKPRLWDQRGLLSPEDRPLSTGAGTRAVGNHPVLVKMTRTAAQLHTFRTATYFMPRWQEAWPWDLLWQIECNQKYHCSPFLCHSCSVSWWQFLQPALRVTTRTRALAADPCYRWSRNKLCKNK